MPIFTVPEFGGGGGGGGPPGPPGDTRYYFRYSFGNGGVPANGTRFLRLAQAVFASETGDLLTDDGAIRGISVTINEIDAARAYEVRALSDPSGAGGTGPTTEATLALPVSTLRARRRDLNVPISGLLDLGVSVVRTAGAGGSTFDEIVVILEVSIP